MAVAAARIRPGPSQHVDTAVAGGDVSAADADNADLGSGNMDDLDALAGAITAPRRRRAVATNIDGYASHASSRLLGSAHALALRAMHRGSQQHLSQPSQMICSSMRLLSKLMMTRIKLQKSATIMRTAA